MHVIKNANLEAHPLSKLLSFLVTNYRLAIVVLVWVTTLQMWVTGQCFANGLVWPIYVAFGFYNCLFFYALYIIVVVGYRTLDLSSRLRTIERLVIVDVDQ